MEEFSRFPARVLFSDGRLLRKAAVVIAGGRAQAAEKAGAGVTVVAERTDVASIERLADRTTLVTFADGSTWRVGKGEGCSCGSPLKTWYSQQLRAATGS